MFWEISAGPGAPFSSEVHAPVSCFYEITKRAIWDECCETQSLSLLKRRSLQSVPRILWCKLSIESFWVKKALRVPSCRWSRTSVFSLMPVICGETIIGREKEDSLQSKVSGQRVLHTFWGPFFIQQSLYSQFWRKRIFPDNRFAKEETHAAFSSNKTLDLLPPCLRRSKHKKIL